MSMEKENQIHHGANLQPTTGANLCSMTSHDLWHEKEQSPEFSIVSFLFLRFLEKNLTSYNINKYWPISS